MHKQLITLIISTNFACLAMQLAPCVNTSEAKVDFTTQVPREIVTKIIFHAIKPEENVLIKTNLKELVNFSQVNKSLNQLIRNNNALSIQNLAKFFKITDRAIALHLTNLGAIKPEILKKYPCDESLTIKLIDALKKNDESTIDELIQQNANIDCEINDDKETPLIYAAINKKTTLVQKLINAGTDLNRHDKNGWTALIFACALDNIQLAQLLIKAGADINRQDDEGDTALMCAYRNNIKMVPLLIDAGADLNIRDKDGWTALMYVCARDNNNIQLAQLLFNAGADIHLKNNSGFIALDIAIRDNHSAIVELLQSKKS